jgi:hypothetical protein
VRDHLVDDPVLPRLVGRHEVVALRVLRDPLERLAGVLGEDLLEAALDVDDLARLDLDVGCLSLEVRGQLVDQDLCVRQRRPLPGVPPARSSAAIAIAAPTQVVWMSGFTNCIVS